MLERCVESLSKTRYRSFETVILDDHSDGDGSYGWLPLHGPGAGPARNFNFRHCTTMRG
jgi:hypothetical protein